MLTQSFKVTTSVFSTLFHTVKATAWKHEKIHFSRGFAGATFHSVSCCASRSPNSTLPTFVSTFGTEEIVEGQGQKKMINDGAIIKFSPRVKIFPLTADWQLVFWSATETCKSAFHENIFSLRAFLLVTPDTWPVCVKLIARLIAYYTRFESSRANVSLKSRRHSS